MNDFTVGELEKLIKDGIKTVELIQQNPEEFQKTYGRSSIPKQTTRERIQAWEGFAAAKDPNIEQPGGVQGETERADKAKGPRDSGADGGNGEANWGDSLFSKARPKTNNQQGGDAENSDGNSSRDRDASTSGSSKDGTRGHPQPSGIDESPGYHADGRVDASDMRQLMMMDHDSSAVETGSLVVPTMTLRNATTEDFAQVFAEGAPKEHRRLRGITTMTSKAKSSDKTTGPVKKGAPPRILYRHFWGTYHHQGMVQSRMCTRYCYTSPVRMRVRKMPRSVCEMYRRPGLLQKVTRLHAIVRHLKERLTCYLPQ
nr:W protein [Jingmen Apodemus agrarius jeilongvirus 1]